MIVPGATIDATSVRMTTGMTDRSSVMAPGTDPQRVYRSARLASRIKSGQANDLVEEIWIYFDRESSRPLKKIEIHEYVEEATGKSYPENTFSELFK